jgi:hypothetical protein
MGLLVSRLAVKEYVREGFYGEPIKNRTKYITKGIYGY